jgi:hypothetical protein
MNKNDNKSWEDMSWEDKKELLKEQLRDQFTYTVHTDCRVGEQSKDCFYGWNKTRRGEACIQHTALQGMSFDNAAWISKLLEDLNYQVVVTRDDDWSKVVNEENVAVRYKADHVH